MAPRLGGGLVLVDPHLPQVHLVMDPLPHEEDMVVQGVVVVDPRTATEEEVTPL